MNWIKFFNISGLLLGIAGALLMFLNTPHLSKKPVGSGGMETMKQSAAWIAGGVKEKEAKEKSNVRMGMLLLIGGFIAQIISTILS